MESKSTSLKRLNKTVLVEILKFLEGKEVFKMGLVALNKKVYNEMGLTQHMLMRQLGIISDYAFEASYLSRVLSLPEESVQSLPSNYEDKQVCQQYFQMFPRKRSVNLHLFGYQAIGGSEIVDGRDKAVQLNSIKHLFIKSQGYYCSSNECGLAVASGIFYIDPDYEVIDEEEINDLVAKVEKVSRECGYNIFDDFASQQNIPVEDRGQIMIMLAKHCTSFVDARYKRQFIEAYKGKKVKPERSIIQYGVLRQLIFNSTSSEHQKDRKKLVQFDIRVHQRLSVQQLFSFNGVYFQNAGSVTCPVRSLFVFAHNQEDVDFEGHPLVQALNGVRTKEELEALVKEVKQDFTHPLYKLMPRMLSKSESQSKKSNIDLVEFDHSFYIDAFRDRSESLSSLGLRRLRLCAFLDFHEETGHLVSFRQSFAGRYVSLLFTDRTFRDIGGDDNLVNAFNGVKDYVNYDVSTVYFQGHVVPSLLKMN